MPDRPAGTITFLFTDIEGSTQLWERHPDAMKSALARHDALVRDAIQQHNGLIFKTVGDAFYAAFPSAPDAVDAALAAHRSLVSEKWAKEIGTLAIRVALHTGTAEERDGDYFGPPLNRVSRMLNAGHGGQTLLSLATQELVRDQLPAKTALFDLGEHRLKDLFRPEHIFQLNTTDLPSEFPPLKTLDAKLTNLPAQPTPFIGRERELTAVLALMRRDDVRMVTLTGPGGTGKTRLSLQAAVDLLDEYRDGVWFINLAPVTDPDLVGSTIGRTFGLPEYSDKPILETLEAYLREKEALLLIDNFEQVVEAAPVVGTLLAAAARLKIVVTSREVLRVRGEHDYPVPPLGLPEKKPHQTVAVLSQYEAVRLFIDRAKAAKADFEITDQNAPAIAEICARLDGLPLAIELAAARARLFAPDKLLAKLSDRLDTLRGGPRDLPKRQQTLRDAIAWSYDLLGNAEKTLFARLGVFQGGRALEAVEVVCRDDLDVAEGLESLINKSLLRQEEGPDGEPRFVMLETIHEFARERLRDSGEAGAIQRRHAEYFTQWVERIEPELRGGGTQLKWFQRLEVEYGNLRAALEWAFGDGDAELGMRIAGSILWFWWRQGHAREWDKWTTLALERVQSAAQAVRAKVFTGAGYMEWARGDQSQAKMTFDKACAIYLELHDTYNMAWAQAGQMATSIGKADEYGEAVALGEEALSLFRQLNDKPGIAQTLTGLGELFRLQGDFERAGALYEEALAIALELGDKLRERIMYANLGYIAEHNKNYQQAQALQKKGLALSLEMGNKQLIAWSLSVLAATSRALGQPQQAARLLGAGQAQLEALGLVLQPGDQPEFDRAVALVREELGEETFNGLRAEGARMSLDESVTYALEEHSA